MRGAHADGAHSFISQRSHLRATPAWTGHGYRRSAGEGPIRPRPAAFVASAWLRASMAAGWLLSARATSAVSAVLETRPIGQLPPVAALGDWSAADLRSADPIPTEVAAGSTVLLLPAAGWWPVVV